jgi:methyl-accepting chemotaxis protein
MKLRKFLWSTALLAASIQTLAQSNANAPSGQMPPGHGIKCLKADGTPCGNPEVSDLNQTVTDAKTTVADSQSTVSDAQQNVSDTQQVGSDAQQVGSDMKQPLANPKQTVSDAKQAVSDVKSAVGDVQQTKSDAQQAAQDVKQNLEDVKKTLKNLAGIKSLSLKALDGSMNCAQNDGSACTDIQTRALKTQAAQKTPPLTVTREVDQPAN